MINKTNATEWNPIYHILDESISDQSPEEDLPPLIKISLIIIGTIGNLVVCLAILFNKKLQNVRNYFLLSLAFTDLMVSLVILPSRMVTVRYMFQPSTFPLCFLYLVGDDFITAASAIHICFLSILSYYSLKNKCKYITTKEVVAKIGLVWLLAFVSVIPYMTIAITSQHPNQPKFCAELLSNFNYFDSIVLIEGLVILTMIMVVFISFILTINLLHKMSKQDLGNGLADEKGLVETTDDLTFKSTPENKKNYQVLLCNEGSLRVTWLISFAFIVSVGPYACVSLFYVTFPHIIIPTVLLNIVGYLSYVNSVINPFIYAIFDKTFRESFHNVVLFPYKRLTH